MNHARRHFLALAVPLAIVSVSTVISGILMISNGGWFIPFGSALLFLGSLLGFFLYVMDKINLSE